MATWPTVTDDDGTGTTGTSINEALFDSVLAYINNSGADASKAGSPVVGQRYTATDTLKVYYCFVAGTWTEIPTGILENLVRNAAFASRSGGTAAKPDEWVLEGTPTIAYDTVDVGYGDFAVEITATGAGFEGIKQTLTNLKPSTSYQLSCRVKVTAGGDQARMVTGGGGTNPDKYSTSTTWETLRGTIITDASGTDVTIYLQAKADGDIVWFSGLTCVEGVVAPANFVRRLNETVWLTTPIVDASWNGDGKSTSEADLDLSGFGNGCPAKIIAVYLSFTINDEASATDPSWISFGVGGVAIAAGTHQAGLAIQGLTNDVEYHSQGWVTCDASGDIRFGIVASGANTLDVYIRIWGYVLGE